MYFGRHYLLFLISYTEFQVLNLHVGILKQKILLRIEKDSVLMVRANEVIIWFDYRVDKWQGTARPFHLAVCFCKSERDGRSTKASRAAWLAPKGQFKPTQLACREWKSAHTTRCGLLFCAQTSFYYMPRVSMANMIRTHSRYTFCTRTTSNSL